MIWYESAEEDFRREKGDIESNEKTRNYDADIETTNQWEAAILILNQPETFGGVTPLSFFKSM